MSKKRSSVTTKIKSLNGKSIHTYYHVQILNLNVGDLIKNKPSLCNVFDIMREKTCKLPS